MTDYTNKIISELEMLLRGEVSNKDKWRMIAYRKAINAIDTLGTPIYSVDDVKGVKNVGKRTIEKIQEIIDNGFSKKAEAFRKDPKVSLISSLTGITGIGPVAANKLVKDKGVTSMDDLAKRATELLTPRQQLGLKHYQDLMKKIPRSEVFLHEEHIKTFCDDSVTMTIAGSYRRGKQSSGDIDVLIRDNRGQGKRVYNELIQKMKDCDYLVDDISFGDTKYNGYCRHPKFEHIRRIDIMYTSPKEFPFALLYFTGSSDFNQEMRAQLSKIGYRLSEHGLKKLENGSWVNVEIPSKLSYLTEKDIFAFFGIPYIRPNDRSREILNLITKGSITIKNTPKPKTLRIKSTPKALRIKSTPKALKIKSLPKSLKIKSTPKALKIKEVSVHPMKHLDVGQSIDYNGHLIKRTSSNAYFCDCQGWRYQSRPPNLRTCKHLKELLGIDYEKNRLGEENFIASKPVGRGGVKSIATAEPKTTKTNLTISPLLANKWSPDKDPTGWWMSEKLDGIRAIWDGKNLISRLGNPFPAPKWFLDKLPKNNGMILDGELFTERKNFQETVSIVRNSGMNKEWEKITYMVFDIPSMKDTFESRYQYLERFLNTHQSSSIKLLEHTKCVNMEEMETKLDTIIKLGGEGIMLRQPKSEYVEGRSNTLLKVKNFYDAEAIVIDIADGRGRHKGRMGALICKMESGKQFRVGTGFSDAVRNDPPKVGSIITYRFQELTKDKIPRFPSFVGPRIDALGPKDFKF